MRIGPNRGRGATQPISGRCVGATEQGRQLHLSAQRAHRGPIPAAIAACEWVATDRRDLIAGRGAESDREVRQAAGMAQTADPPAPARTLEGMTRWSDPHRLSGSPACCDLGYVRAVTEPG